jgi:hypothetical protein
LKEKKTTEIIIIDESTEDFDDLNLNNNNPIEDYKRK